MDVFVVATLAAFYFLLRAVYQSAVMLLKLTCIFCRLVAQLIVYCWPR